MSRSVLFPLLLGIGITLLSAFYTYSRAGVLDSGNEIAVKGLESVSRDTAIFYALVSVFVGGVGFFVFRGMLASSPKEARQNFLLLAIGIGVVLEMLALMVFKGRGLIDLTLLHMVYIVGYGWLLPQLMSS